MNIGKKKAREVLQTHRKALAEIFVTVISAVIAEAIILLIFG